MNTSDGGMNRICLCMIINANNAVTVFPHQVAKLLNVWPETLRRWEKERKLKPLRTPGGHRRYKESQIKKLLGEDQGANNTSKNCIIYARVSTNKP